MYGLHRQPDYPAAIAQIGSLSSEELEAYLNEDGDQKLEEFVKSLSQVKDLYREKEMLLASNKSLAEYNYSQKPVLESQTAALQAKKEEAVALAKNVKALRSELDAQSKKVQPDVLLSLLEASYAEAEEFSEKLADGFLDGNEENLDEFLEKFQEARKLSHCRRVKVDKMKEIIADESIGASKHQHSNLSSGPTTIPQQQPPYPTYPSLASGPYPQPTIEPPNPYNALNNVARGPKIHLPYPPQPSVYNPFMPSYPPLP